MVDVQVRRELAQALWAGLVDQGSRRASGGARRLPRRRGLRALGRQGASRRKPNGSLLRGAGSRTRNSPGDELAPSGRQMANTSQGEFPHHNLSPHAYKLTTPVGSFPPNDYGLYDMIGTMSGGGRSTGSPRGTKPTRRRRAAFPRTRAGVTRPAATTPASRRSGSRAR